MIIFNNIHIMLKLSFLEWNKIMLYPTCYMIKVKVSLKESSVVVITAAVLLSSSFKLTLSNQIWISSPREGKACFHAKTFSFSCITSETYAVLLWSTCLLHSVIWKVLFQFLSRAEFFFILYINLSYLHFVRNSVLRFYNILNI